MSTKHKPESGEVVSVALTLHMLELMTWRGLQADSILAAAGLTTDSLNNRDGWLPVEKGAQMVHAAIQLSQDPLFYLKLSQHTFISGYGIIGYLLESSPTLKEAMCVLTRYERLISSVAFSKLSHQPGQVLWGLECRFDDPLLVQQMTEFYIGCRYLFMLLVKEKRSHIVSAIHFSHAPPVGINVAEEYGKVFRCPVLFNQPISALIIKPAALSFPLRQVEPSLRMMLESHADQKLNDMLAASSLLAQARVQLRMLLHTGHPSRELLAERLNVSSRHLSRQLQAEGSSYRALLDELRLELAREQLRNTSKTQDEIATLLSFGDAQSFMRWFRQLTGHTPGDYRAQAAAG